MGYTEGNQVNKFFKGVAALITAVGLVFGLAACSSESLNMSKVTSVIDVRTAAEYAAGHLQGAINIDVEGSAFATEIGKLDMTGTYVVYCHSGRRAGVAMEQMTGLGFKNVTNAGGIEAAANATGLPIVQ
jgi:phage shock protein E